MRTETEVKLQHLKENLQKLGEVVVAYSGGVDSTLLLKVCKDVLGDKANAVIGFSPSFPKKEFNEALDRARQVGVEPTIVETQEFSSDKYCANPEDRCYHCKKIIFRSFIDFVEVNNYKYLLDGSNHDDLSDYRPGKKALKEYGVISPFLDAGITKDEIREISKELGLSTWNKEAMACLSTRIAYGESITIEKLTMIEKAETYLSGLGFKHVRARINGEVLRIESKPEQLHMFFKNNTRKDVLDYMKNLGFKYVSIDMEGYRQGSMNTTVLSKQ